MRDATITKHIHAIAKRLDELEANELAMAKVIARQQQTIGEQQLKIDAMALCLKAELGISVDRAQGYRQQVIDERRRELEAQHAAAVDTAHLDAKRGTGETGALSSESNPAGDDPIAAESESKDAAGETANAA